MFIDYTPQEAELQREVRARMAALMTPELRAELDHTEGGGPLYHAAIQQLGDEGWLGLGWPEEHGGQGRPFIEQYIFFDEVHRSGFPIPLLTLNTVGPTLAQFGTEAQRAELLPRILAGTCHFAIGYTEPNAGTDLASLTTKAVRDGDDFVITGQKIFTSLADFADYLWLAVRTDADAPKHAGISILIVPMASEGLTTTRIRNIGDSNIHAVYLDQVRVPATALVGELNQGWRLVTSQLNYERVALMTFGPMHRLFEEVAAWARETPAPEGGRIVDRPWVQMTLARLEARLEVLKLMNWKQAWAIGEGALGPHDASAIKVYGSELFVEGFGALMEVMGEAGSIERGSPGALLRGDLERHYRATLVLTFGGGTNEVQRDIIGMAGLRLPRDR